MVRPFSRSASIFSYTSATVPRSYSGRKDFSGVVMYGTPRSVELVFSLYCIEKMFTSMKWA